jgi:2-polyprenyl-3-methyl-5-hydroxy-6-metoxy-1,4-benzoquinol methylase
MESIFRRRQETYSENENLLRWIREDSCNPLNQIANLIDSGRVLDIGCGTGILGRLLGDKYGVEIDGVDPGVPNGHPGIIGYRSFYSCGIEEVIERGGIESYDWIVLADVIEHFPYPDELLYLLATHAKSGCKFVVSTPNVAYLTTRLDLMAGRFDYVPSGVLESTHLRLCTFHTLSNVVRSAGLSMLRVILLNRIPSINNELGGYSSRSLLAPLIAGDDPYLLTYQFLVILTNGDGEADPDGLAITVVGPKGKGDLYLALLQNAVRCVKRKIIFWR